MSDYKEDTVGWWLSQLKEPLKEMAFLIVYEKYANQPCKSMREACIVVMDHFAPRFPKRRFWFGVEAYFEGAPMIGDEQFNNGWDMAKECAPGGEEKQPKVWTAEDVQQHLVENPHTSAYGPNGEVLHQGKPIIIRKGLNTDTDLPAIPDGYVDALNWIPLIAGGLIDDKLPRPKFDVEVVEIPAPRAKPIATVMTIEMQHEKRIEALEARVKDLEEIVKYLSLKANGAK